MVLARVCLLTGLASFSSALWAQTMYVSDVQFVAIRSAPNGSASVVERAIKSGEAMEILQKGDEFTKVRTHDGNEGWIQNYFLMDDPASRDRVDQLSSKVASLEQQRQSLQVNLDALQQERNTLKSSLDQAEQQRTSLSNKLSNLDSEVKAVDQWKSEKTVLTQQISTLQSDLSNTKEENQRLRKNENVSWFVTGAGAVLAGVILGVMLSMFKRRKKQSEWV
ncbi:TIGR04211 family SH3 domain-containing protein [Pokkaliibacter plantistimulans]|uniref:TIGR04211 family SH3 domain-containing protein n=1 Tax=Proteobacteria bacterium 228 TaxID=2083153 RepID=A0A2S5KJ25_9PROT|nr:TIGR04211 family SH3 domain-containing protein [Pokkaliibacter plantistimulans]PPC74824.1 TIGR04211 family SH3 domain-containing protein [Pokkaliibacter plantistimulans]